MTVAILALQGAFIEHQKKIESLGHNCIELRCKEDLNKPFDRLILPGGESTAQGKLLRELEMFTRKSLFGNASRYRKKKRLRKTAW